MSKRYTEAFPRGKEKIMRASFTLISQNPSHVAMAIATWLAYASHNTTPVDSRYTRPEAWSSADMAGYVAAAVCGQPSYHAVRPEWAEFNAELKKVGEALLAWAAGQSAAYDWTQTCETYPIDDGVTISGRLLRIWVANSTVTIRREAEGVFAVSADGARASFAANHTGAIGADLVSGRLGRVEDLRVESEGEEVDRLPANLFRRSFKARREQALNALLVMYGGSDELAAAAAAFRAALDVAEPRIIAVRRVNRENPIVKVGVDEFVDIEGGEQAA